MPRVFVDTAAWVALLNTRDELHESAQKQLAALRRQNAQLITTEFVLVELANMFSAPVWRQKVVRFIDGRRACRIFKSSPPILCSWIKVGSCFAIGPTKNGV